jgi:protein-tyrosine phosphatase
MPEILVICTANICRSPVVEALLRDRLTGTDLNNEPEADADWRVSSAGTLAWPGHSAADFSIEVMTERGFDLSEHRSQRAEAHHLATADLVLCMEWGHKEALQIEFPDHRDKIFLLTEMVGNMDEVADPIGGPRVEYEQMIDEVTQLIDDGLPHILQIARDHAAARSNVQPPLP